MAGSHLDGDFLDFPAVEFLCDFEVLGPRYDITTEHHVEQVAVLTYRVIDPVVMAT